jgi:hypothetical protein
MLDQYIGRGLRVSGVSLQFTSLQVAHRHPRSVSLLVVDRLGASVAVDHSGHRQVLPRDRPTRHRIDLRKVDHTWRIARISLV